TSRVEAALDPALCQNFKNMGYQVYVVYTPYYPLMNPYYLNTLVPQIPEGTGTGSAYAGLQQCATDPVNDFIEANPADQNSINAALSTFLLRALTSPARFTF
ncbi:MAG TPA: hypothetical protein VMB71_15725, partial [Acetobacteraceae bacterium]|nr:hypothetical protein [Acetobacteraceae bacterium]